MNITLSLLPSQEHDANLRNNIAILVSRVLATRMPFFQFVFSDKTFMSWLAPRVFTSVVVIWWDMHTLSAGRIILVPVKS